MASDAILFRSSARNLSSIPSPPCPIPIGRRAPSSIRWRRPRTLRFRAELTFSCGTHLIPHPKKIETGGEDAFLVSNYSGGVLAVADGVSGWADRNVNPALFSQELMRHAASLVEDEEVNYDPVNLLKKAHGATCSKGSATVIVAMLEKNGVLKIASIGDCGLRVIRGGHLIFSTTPREHYFDCPYQLSSEVVGQTYRDATVCSINLEEGDIVVMGSDGLFDNLFDGEIISTISGNTEAPKAAKALADLASDHSKDISYDSPYSTEARSRGFDVPSWKKLLGQKLVGGKPDDITVIVAKVVRTREELSSPAQGPQTQSTSTSHDQSSDSSRKTG